MNNFKEAVLTTDEIKNCYRQGLQSLNEHSTKVVVQNTRELKRLTRMPIDGIIYSVIKEKHFLWKCTPRKQARWQ